MALVSSRQVLAQGATPAGVSLSALVNVLADDPVGPEALTTGAGAVLGALGVVRAVKVGGAGGAHLDGLAGEAAVTGVAGGTVAAVAGALVDTERAHAALVQRARLALVDVCVS